MSTFKYNIGDKIQLNKTNGLNYGDYFAGSLTLSGVYEIVDRCTSVGKNPTNKRAYNILFNLKNGEKTTWWVGECDIKPVFRQLTFVFSGEL